MSDEPDSGPAPSEGRAEDRGRRQLVVFSGDDLKTYELPASGNVTIGRAQGNTVRIDDASVSREHAVIHVGENLLLEDLGGPNGTFIRDRHHPGPGDETLNLRQVVRRTSKVRVGDGIVIGAVSAVIRHAPQKEIPAPLDADTGAIVRSPAMKAVYDQAALAARSNISVLILGETGVGKDVLARAVHAYSPRARAPFMGINCAALAESVLETELFGCEKGAFTGAAQAREGLFEAADPGTVFLDEVGELPLVTQAKLLRVIEDRSVMRVGSNRVRKLDVRFIAATNRDLEAGVEENGFRRDLYFRLNGIALTVPPLRLRAEEIEPLARRFLAASARELERSRPLQLSEPALAALLRHSWPGNVRELRNVIERAAVLCPTDTILVDHFPASLCQLTKSEPPRAAATVETRGRESAIARLKAEVLADERARVEEALKCCGGNQTRAAELLGISRRTLVTRLGALNLTRPRNR